MSNEAHYSPVPGASQYEDKDHEVRVVSPHKPRQKPRVKNEGTVRCICDYLFRTTLFEINASHNLISATVNCGIKP